MRVLLISANRLAEPYPVYPLGLDYVAGALSDDHEVARLDMNGLSDDGALPTAIRRFAPEIIGISLRNIDNTDTTAPHGFIAEYRRLVKAVRAHCQAPRGNTRVKQAARIR